MATYRLNEKLVRDMMKNQGKTYRDIYDKAGLIQSTLAHALEKKNPTMDTAGRLSEALGLGIEHVGKLFERIEDEKENIYPSAA